MKTISLNYESDYVIGDEVLIKTLDELYEADENYEGAWNCGVEIEMGQYASKTATIVEIDSDGDIKLDIDGREFFWSPYYLMKVIEK